MSESKPRKFPRNEVIDREAEQYRKLRTGVRAGLPGGGSPAWDHAQGKPFEPQIIPLYGVVISPV